MRLKNRIRVLLIATLTIVLLALFLRNSDLRDVWKLIRSVHPGWLLVGFGANILALVARAMRWRTILDPDHPPPFYPTFFATAIGFMSSIILPIRAGDVVRPALLSRRTSIRFSSALGTVLTERLLDLSSILILFLTFAGMALSSPSGLSRPKELFLRTGGTTAALVFLGLVIFVFSVIRFREAVRRAHGWLGALVPVRFRESWVNLFDSFSQSLRFPRNRIAMLRIVLLTAVVWLCLTSQFYFVMRAFGRPLPYQASFLVTAMSILGFSIPTPGGVGGFHKACQIVLVNFYGFDVDASVAVALLFHLVGTLPVLLTGAALFLREGLTFRQLEKLATDQTPDGRE